MTCYYNCSSWVFSMKGRDSINEIVFNWVVRVLEAQMYLTTWTTWLVIVSLNGISIFHKVHNAIRSFETSNDTIACSIIPNNCLGIIKAACIDLKISKKGISRLGMIRVECPCLDLCCSFNLVFLCLRNCSLVARIVNWITFIFDIGPWGAGDTVWVSLSK